MTKTFQFNRADYNASLPRIQQNHAFYIGKPVSMGGDKTMIEYSRDEQILNLFFVMQVSKIEPQAIPVFPPATKAQKTTDIILSVILLIAASVGAIYLLN
ncbi:MAG TPA: hypothetical protein VFC67_22565 [Prolixibacteraceae bacterium]|nr:hypothetical protein [Prolixibacteraceae bacterium]